MTVCGAAEGELPAHCPGRKMTGEQRTLVMRQLIDYVDGNWINYDI